MDSGQAIEQKISQQCSIILSTDAEQWETRNKALLQLTTIFGQFENPGSLTSSGLSLVSVFRILKEPIKSMLLDLRSQQVRDCCQFLIKLSEVTRDELKGFMREFFTIILDALKVPNKVISGYIDDCITKLIKNSVFKTCIPLLGAELRDNKSKPMREFCINYVNEILINWDITDKEGDLMTDIIKIGLQDASIRVREVSRLAYLNLFGIFPKKTEKIKASLPASAASRLVQAEESCLKAKLVANTNSMRTLAISEDTTQEPYLSIATAKAESKISKALPENDIIVSSSLPIIGHNTELGFRARRQSIEADSAVKIQAVFRGSLLRRKSGINKLPLTPVKQNEGSENGGTILSSLSSKSSPSKDLRAKSPNPKKAAAMLEILRSVHETYGQITEKNGLQDETADPRITADGSHLNIGMSVEIRGREKPTFGIVRYVGKTAFNPDGIWVGIHLSGPNGKNDGSVQGVKYFVCEENYGLFVRPQTVYPLSFTENPMSPLSKRTKESSYRTELCQLSKLKISMTMDILYQQLECIERIEKSMKTADGLGLSTKDDEAMLVTLSAAERELWDVYTSKVQKFK